MYRNFKSALDVQAGSVQWLARLACLFLLTAVSHPAPSAELLSSYQYAGVTYPSLHAAEHALWNYPFFGASFYTYQSTSADGNVRSYYLPPTTDYQIDPMLVFSDLATPCASGGDAPLLDQFGNNWCSNVPSGSCCTSEADWWSGVQRLYSGIDCPPIQTGQGPWIQTSVDDIAYPIVYPEEIIIINARFTKFIEAEFPAGSAPQCGQDRNFNLLAISPGHCPGGYRYFSPLGAADGTCDPITLPQTIRRVGAVTPEPNSKQCSEGNPCYPTTGDKTLAAIDFSAGPLELTRYYHAIQNYPDYAAMGRGWSHTYIGRILIEGNILKMIDGKGDAERFICVDSPSCTLYRSQSEPGHILRPAPTGWEVYLTSGELRHYDRSGKLILITDRSSKFRQVAITYASGDRVSEVIDQTGRALHFDYNATGLLDTITLPDGQQIHYQYAAPAGDNTNNPKFNLSKVIHQDLTARIYHYEDSDGQGVPRYGNLLTGITDENGTRFATYVYDDAARVISSEHAGGAARITLRYTARAGESFKWSITEVTMPLGEVVTFDAEPGPYRNPTQITDARGGLTMSYDPDTGWRRSRKDREGNLTTYQYDSLHQITSVEAAGTVDERVTETDWDNGVNRIAEIRQSGKTVTFTHNDRGQVLTRTETDPATGATRTWTNAYFELPSLAPLIGRLRTVDGPRTDITDVTTYEYYTSDDANGDYLIGDLKAVVDALGHRTDYLKYDANGRLLNVRDANGVLTSLTYHARGWVSSRAMDGKTTSFTYDPAGNLTRITQADGSFIDFEYDAASRLNAIVDNFGNRVAYTLDADGNRTSEKVYDDSGSLHRQLSRVYDQLGRLIAILDGNNNPTSYSYDLNGNRTAIVDANGNTAVYQYDGMQRLVKTIDSMLGETVMDYDTRDNLTGVTDPMGNLTQYRYDGLDNQIELNSPDSGIATFEYDAAGNRTAVIDARAIRARYVYDALNRLTDILYPDSSLDVHFAYDAGNYGKGRLTSMSDSAGTAEYLYNARGNITTETRLIDGAKYVTRYAFNDADRLIGITYPSGMRVDYRLDAAGRVVGVEQTLATAAKSLISDVRYVPFGPMTSFTYGNGLTYHATFDQDYQIDRLQSGSELDWLFNRDAVGNILAIEDQKDSRHTQQFTYDGMYRLDTALGDYGSASFDYDANGNRTHYRSNLTDDVYRYDPQSNRLAAQNGWTFSRDPAGNRTEKLDTTGHGRLYGYADDNRLARLRLRDAGGDTLIAEYVYDGLGRRLGKTVDGISKHFVYGPSGELLGEYTRNGEPLAEYIFLNGQVIAVFTRLSQNPPVAPIEVVIDNEDPEASSTGSWKLKSDDREYGDNYRLGDKSDSYRWTPPPIKGTFDVYAWWVPGKRNSKLATYTISHFGAKEPVVVEQNQGGGEWSLLGRFEFDGSGGEYVELRSGDGKSISADSMRFSRVDAGSGDEDLSAETFFIHGDHLGTPRRISDEFQSLVWRWNSPPFGNSLPDEDPDDDGTSLILNLRLPGQYYDPESGLNYNYFRTYDPLTGRYNESDPIGLSGGYNPFRYVGNNPLKGIDPLGLVVTGSWIEPPRFNLTDIGVDDWELVSPAWSLWGYFKFIRLFGHAAGFINVDVKCNTECKEWEIHNKIFAEASGHHDVGPNIYAIVTGLRAGPLAGVGANVAIGGAALLAAEHHYLNLANEKAGPLISTILALGPAGVCLGTSQGY